MTENKYINLNNLNNPFCKLQTQTNKLLILDKIEGVKGGTMNDSYSTSISSTEHNSAINSRVTSKRNSENKENNHKLCNNKIYSPLSNYLTKTKRNKESEIKYENETFGLFSDVDIGFTHFWSNRLQINYNNEDDDYDTDEEQQSKVKVVLRVKTNSIKKTIIDELKNNNFSLTTNHFGCIKFNP